VTGQYQLESEFSQLLDMLLYEDDEFHQELSGFVVAGITF
jgi:hypothetical protein